MRQRDELNIFFVNIVNKFRGRKVFFLFAIICSKVVYGLNKRFLIKLVANYNGCRVWCDIFDCKYVVSFPEMYNLGVFKARVNRCIAFFLSQLGIGMKVKTRTRKKRWQEKGQMKVNK